MKNKTCTNSDVVAAALLSRATPHEMSILNDYQEKRLSRIDNFRELMFTAGLAFIAIAIPMFISSTITGSCKIAFGVSLCLAISAVLMLVVLMLKSPRQIGEAYNAFFEHVMSSNNRGEFSFQTKETKLEKMSATVWPVAAGLSLIFMVAAIFLK